jgi:hypothetical protein
MSDLATYLEEQRKAQAAKRKAEALRLKKYRDRAKRLGLVRIQWLIRKEDIAEVDGLLKPYLESARVLMAEDRTQHEIFDDEATPPAPRPR